GLGAEVEALVPQGFDHGEDLALDGKSAVVAGNCNLHRFQLGSTSNSARIARKLFSISWAQRAYSSMPQPIGSGMSSPVRDRSCTRSASSGYSQRMLSRWPRVMA